ncbi:hypothetical protein Agub_g135, partial [Astrephomene gubernaculifera]
LPDLLRSCEAGRAVWVLPAWETHKRLGLEEGRRVADRAIRGDKATLRQLESESALHFFAKTAYARGHSATNFTRWLQADLPYDVAYEINYEPWFIMSRRLIPPYDVRFRGYGWNKVQQVASVALQYNFTFRVHPHVWLVHRPHEASAGQKMYGGSGGGGGAEKEQPHGQGQLDEIREWRGSRAPVSRLFHRRVSALRHTAIRDMRRGSYRAAEDPQSEHCR